MLYAFLDSSVELFVGEMVVRYERLERRPACPLAKVHRL